MRGCNRYPVEKMGAEIHYELNQSVRVSTSFVGQIFGVKMSECWEFCFELDDHVNLTSALSAAVT